jgi:hypothetical protein
MPSTRGKKNDDRQQSVLYLFFNPFQTLVASAPQSELVVWSLLTSSSLRRPNLPYERHACRAALGGPSSCRARFHRVLALAAGMTSSTACSRYFPRSRYATAALERSRCSLRSDRWVALQAGTFFKTVHQFGRPLPVPAIPGPFGGSTGAKRVSVFCRTLCCHCLSRLRL